MTSDVEGVERNDPNGDPGTPRWVKVFGLVAVLVIVLVAVMLLSGGHGPSRHAMLAFAGVE